MYKYEPGLYCKEKQLQNDLHNKCNSNYELYLFKKNDCVLLLGSMFRGLSHLGLMFRM